MALNSSLPTVPVSVHPKGTRIRVRKGSFPMDPALVGRTGMVFGHERSEPRRVTVQLDGEDRLRTFTDEELERS